MNKHFKRNIKIAFTVTAIVMVWRGVWGLFDHYLFPENPDLSYITSIILGMLILLVDDFELGELAHDNEHRKLGKSRQKK